MKEVAKLTQPGRPVPGRNVRVRHKHLKMDQTKIDKVRRFFGVATEQEAVDRALEAFAVEEDLRRALRRVAGIGGMSDPWAPRRR